MKITIELTEKEVMELKDLIFVEEKEEIDKEIEKPEEVEYSQYAIIFDESCLGYDKDNPEFTYMFLKRVEKYASKSLRIKKELYLNEVYSLLGSPNTEVGSIVGWRYYDGNINGDNFVDFGIDTKHNAKFFISGKGSIVLDFNVDGCIKRLE